MRHCIALTKILPNTFSGQPTSRRLILCVHLEHSGTTAWHPHALYLIRELKTCSPTRRHNCVSTGTYAVHPRPLKGGNHANDIDEISFRRRSESCLLSKCRRRSGRRSSHEACCNRRFNNARRAVLRASYPTRRHQVLPGIRRGASRVPALLSLVVVKPRSRAVDCGAGQQCNESAFARVVPTGQMARSAGMRGRTAQEPH